MNIIMSKPSDYPRHSMKEVAAQLNVPASTVRWQCAHWEIGEKHASGIRFLSDADVELLREKQAAVVRGNPVRGAGGRFGSK